MVLYLLSLSLWWWDHFMVQETTALHCLVFWPSVSDSSHCMLCECVSHNLCDLLKAVPGKKMFFVGKIPSAGSTLGRLFDLPLTVPPSFNVYLSPSLHLFLSLSLSLSLP